MNVLGGQYVLWRGNDGVAHLFDAYCPHLGANLAFGGEVRENCIKCPFHGWEYDGSGACSKIPYAPEPNKFAKAEVHKLIEQNNLIYFWYDVERREPFWYPPSFPELDNGDFVYHGKTEHHVLAHLQELPENGADIPHLNAVHNSINWFFTHQWEASWAPLSEKSDPEKPEPEKSEIPTTTKNFSSKPKSPPPHLSKYPDFVKTIDLLSLFGKNFNHCTQINIVERVLFRGIPLHFLDVHVLIYQVGPGIVYLRFFTPFGQVLVCQSSTPFGPMVQKACHMIFACKNIPRWMAKTIVLTLGQFYEQDVVIWHWKTYPAKPILSKEDANIRKFRKWFSQFYSEHSLTFEEAVNVYNKGRSTVLVDW